MEYENEQGQQGYDGQRDYPNERERSRSPRPEYRDNGDDRVRNDDGGRDRVPTINAPPEDEEESQNSGTNLFVTGIHPRLTEDDVTRLFEKYGTVDKANIMRDPHTRESRGFGFVNMMTSQEADAAKEGLQGEVYEGRTLSIEKARRAKPRTPTPGKYYGPPKRNDFRGGGRGGGRYGDRYDDRSGGGYGRDYRREDPYYRRERGDYDRGGYGRDSDRSYGRRDRGGDVDRYASGGRDDRYSGRGESRRGGYDEYSRGSGRAEGAPGGYSGGGGAGGSGGADTLGVDDRYSRR